VEETSTKVLIRFPNDGISFHIRSIQSNLKFSGRIALDGDFHLESSVHHKNGSLRIAIREKGDSRVRITLTNSNPKITLGVEDSLCAREE